MYIFYKKNKYEYIENKSSNKYAETQALCLVRAKTDIKKLYKYL